MILTPNRAPNTRHHQFSGTQMTEPNPQRSIPTIEHPLNCASNLVIFAASSSPTSPKLSKSSFSLLKTRSQLPKSLARSSTLGRKNIITILLGQHPTFVLGEIHKLRLLVEIIQVLRRLHSCRSHGRACGGATRFFPQSPWLGDKITYLEHVGTIEWALVL